MKGSVRLAGLVAGLLLVVPTSAAAADQAMQQYRVEGDQAELQELARLGYDVQEGLSKKDPGSTLIATTPTEASRLERRGFEVESLDANVQGQSVAIAADSQDPFEGLTARPYDVYRPYNLQPTGPVTPGGPPQINIRTELQQLGQSDRVKLVTIGHSRTGLPIIAAKVTTDADTVPDNTRPAVLYSSNQHAREWISVEVNRRLLHYMAETDTPEVQQFRDTREMWFVVTLNPDGYDWTFTGNNRLWRKNLRDNDGNGTIDGGEGVDLNRNARTSWGFDNEGSSANPSSGTYRGPSPVSEPESQAIDNLYNRVDFKFQSNWHSAAELLLYPHGFQVETPVADNPIFTAIAGDDADPAIPGFDPDLSAELYTTNGELTDHANAAYGVLAYTPELTPGDNDRPGGGEPNPGGFRFQDIEADVQAEFENTLQFSLDLARSAGDPDDPVSHLGNTVPDLEVNEFEVSHGSPQTVQANVKRPLGPVSMFYEINNSGNVHRVDATEWNGGERFGVTGDVYYHKVRGTVTGAGAGDRVTVSFGAGSKRSEAFTYRVRSDTNAPVLVLAAENYDGPAEGDVQPAGPHYLRYYADALRSNGIDFDVYDIDVNEQTAPDPLGVLSHYKAVVWYSGDDRIPQRPGQPADSGVGKFGDDTINAVRAYLNEGGKVLYTGERAGFFIDDSLFGYNPLEAQNGFCSDNGFDEPPGQIANCNIVSDDFMQYWLGVFSKTDVANTKDEATGLELGLPGDPFGDMEFRLNGAGSADNQDHAFAATPASDVLSVEDFPQFRSRGAVGVFGPAPATGARYALASTESQAWKRLTRTVDLRGRTGGELTFKTAFGTEKDFDYLFVEAHTLDDAPDDDWTTLPDTNGHTSQALPVSSSCEGNWRNYHPQSVRYQTDTDGQNGCEPTGTTGAWHAASGNSNGYQDWKIDLTPYAGKQVELSITYATDTAAGFFGAVVDDVAVRLTSEDGGTVTDQTSFESGLGGWTASNPESDNPQPVDPWSARRAIGFAGHVGVATDRSLYWGFGLEGVRGADTRIDLMASAMRYLGVEATGGGGGGGTGDPGGNDDGDGGNAGNDDTEDATNGSAGTSGSGGGSTGAAGSGGSSSGANSGAITGSRGDSAAEQNLRIRTRRARVSRSGVARIRVSCARGARARCAGTVRLRYHRRTLARAKVSVRAGRTKTVRLRLSRKGMRIVRKRSRVSVRAVAASGARGHRMVLRAARAR